MDKPRLEAHFENRVYYFFTVAKAPERVVINMYSTEYIFVRKDTGWENAGSNKNIMVQGLVDAVIHTLGA